MKRQTFSRLISLLLAVLLGGTWLATLGNDRTRQPTSVGYGPHSLQAFCELLRRQGYHVETEYSNRPVLKPGELAIACTQPRGEETLNRSTAVDGAIEDHLQNGGAVLEMGFPHQEDPTWDSKVTQASLRSRLRKGPLTKVAPVYEAPDQDQRWMREGQSIGLCWIGPGGQAFAGVRSNGKGLLVQVSDGLLATNARIDRGDNAEIMMRLVRYAQPEPGRVVFLEGSFGNGFDPSLLEMVGPGLLAAWRQLWFVLIVAALAYGVRFGVTKVERRTEAGARQFVDALTSVLARRESHEAATAATLGRAEAIIRKRLKVPASAPIEVLLPRIPEPVASAYRVLAYGKSDLLGASIRLDRELADWTEHPTAARSRI